MLETHLLPFPPLAAALVQCSLHINLAIKVRHERLSARCFSSAKRSLRYTRRGPYSCCFSAYRDGFFRLILHVHQQRYRWPQRLLHNYSTSKFIQKLQLRLALQLLMRSLQAAASLREKSRDNWERSGERDLVAKRLFVSVGMDPPHGQGCLSKSTIYVLSHDWCLVVFDKESVNLFNLCVISLNLLWLNLIFMTDIFFLCHLYYFYAS